MPFATPTRAIRFSLLIALFATAACGRFGIGSSSETPSPAPRDARMAPISVNVGPMLTHINRYRAGPPHSYLRPARDGGQVRVEVSALGNSIDVDPRNGPAGFRVIGVVENKDARNTERQYGLKPGTRYLIWVGRGPMNSTNNSRTRWGLLEYPRTQTGVFPSQPLGYVLWCQNHRHPAGTVSDVDFRDPASCNVDVSAEGNPAVRFASWTTGHDASSHASGHDLQRQGSGTFWMRCATGCCYLSSRY
jgi:hypothetical protein